MTTLETLQSLLHGHHAKNLNKHIILDLVRFSQSGISRAELARQMGLSRAAITAIVNDLIERNLLRETESQLSASGRRPISLDVNPQAGLVVGIDMGATHLDMVLADFSGRVVHEIQDNDFRVTVGPAVCLPMVNEQMRRLLHEAGIGVEQVMAIGMGVPGPVQAGAGMVSAPPIMPGWDNYPIQQQLQEMWHLPVVLDNDADLGALGEWAYGAGRNEQHLAYIKVGSGIGAGLLFNGQIYRGAAGYAGEIGHITIRGQGAVCSCGNRGCLEAVAGGTAIARQAREAIAANRRTQLSSIQPVEQITARDVAVAARMGDLVAQQIVAEAGANLGVAVAGLVNLFNPTMVVIGGGVAQMGDLLLEPIRQAVQERSLRASSHVVRIVAAVLGRRSTSMGAVAQALTFALHRLAEVG